MPSVTESIVEQFLLDELARLGYTVISGPEIAPDQPGAERVDFSQVILPTRLRSSLHHLNPGIPDEAIEDAYRKITLPTSPSLVQNNRAFHRMLVDGVAVEYRNTDGTIKHDNARLFDFEYITNNDWLAVNQLTIIEDYHNRRPDVVLFLNGLPLVVVELKNAADEKATIWSAYNQIQTYKQEITSLFQYNELLVISDGTCARLGTLTADRSYFLPWKTVEGRTLADSHQLELDTLTHGVFEQTRLLDLLRHFILFEEEEDGNISKKVSGYHQYHAVNIALQETLRAAEVFGAHRAAETRSGYRTNLMKDGKPGDHRVGVVWHTQGAGKSLTMVFYAGKLILQPEMANPTLVIITDRNDLDDQLFGTFSRCHDILRQKPVRAGSQEDLVKLLRRVSGGVIFTTIQKFLENNGVLSDRSNIVVIADEAHRSQYDFIDGYARHMRDALPNASFIGFTGTPIETTDHNTRAVFGDYISVYDIQQAVTDGATVPIYYEGRLAKLELKEAEKPHLDADFEEATEGEEVDKKEKLKSKWAALEAVVGAEKRLKLIARDIVEHFEARQQALHGKGMIVCMSRRICVDMYNAIAALRPGWISTDDKQGILKIVMTGSASDLPDWQQHIRNKERREKLADRFKKPGDSFELVIVRDMWLTGFDAKSLHTMYVDKPMRGHGLMQAIARVNRVFHDKPGGLIVDYLGLADELRQALALYTESGGTGEAALDQEQAVGVMMEKVEICRGLFHGFDWSAWLSSDGAKRLRLLPSAQNHILKITDGKNRLLKAVADLSAAFALSVPHEQAMAIREEVGFYQQVRSVLAKTMSEGSRAEEDLDHAIQQIISRAVASDEVIDIFTAAGLKKPDISILSDEFLADIEHMPQRNLALELLRKLLNDEIKLRSRKFLVQSRSFREMLEQTIRRYQNRAIETAQVIEELIKLAKEMRAASERGDVKDLTDDEIAFYDALEVNDSAVKVLGDENLKFIARELVETIRKNVTIDWTVRETVRAKLRVNVKRILRKYGYPPDLQEKATTTVLEQAELIAAGWV